MMTIQIPDKIKDNPWTTAGAILGVIVSLVSTIFALDSRYIHAADFNQKEYVKTADFEQLKQSQQQGVDKTVMIIMYSSDQTRKKIILEKIEDIQDVPEKERTQRDRSRLESLKLELDEINKKWPAKDIPK